MVRQFAYVHRVAGILLLSRKNTSVAVQFFSFSKTATTNPNHQKERFLHSSHRIHNGLQNGPKSKPPLHGLSLKKYPIKNHATLFQVKSSSRSNTTKLHKIQHSGQKPVSKTYPHLGHFITSSGMGQERVK